ncbi:helix-hairpin-helix domain-containing protein [Candidatus Woesebacteria bacterium]|nr:helix-hairpin-helix domain-containing protein [Candidatus Woesebacteria bacterium]
MRALVFPISVSSRLLLGRIGAVFLLLCGIAVSSVGIWGMVQAWNVYGATEPDLLVCDSKEENDTTKNLQITVAVSGAVLKPGMYTLSQGSRVGDVLEKAGGFASDVDSVFSQTQLNLAQTLTDGEGLYVPLQADTEIISQCENLIEILGRNSERSGGGVEMTKTSGELISINSASFDALDSLPGIGEKRAEAIIAGRPYASLDELVERAIVTETVFDELKDLIQL